MPTAPLKPCRKNGCNILGTTTFCDNHAKKQKESAKAKKKSYEETRGTRTERGYNNEWLRASKSFREGKVCVECEKEGVVKMSQCTDHIIPHKGDMKLFWDIANWQPLCFVHHNKKTAEEDGGFGNK